MIMHGNLFQSIPADLPDELLETLYSCSLLQIERIVSRGQASPPGFWFDQEQDEFVLLVQGRAGLRFKDEDSVRILEPGDYLIIPARNKHRVEWTDSRSDTIWLAVHFPVTG